MSRLRLAIIVILLMIAVAYVMLGIVYPAARGALQFIEGAPYNGPEKEWGHEVNPLTGPPTPWIKTVPWLVPAILIGGTILLLGFGALKYFGLI